MKLKFVFILICSHFFVLVSSVLVVNFVNNQSNFPVFDIIPQNAELVNDSVVVRVLYDHPMYMKKYLIEVTKDSRLTVYAGSLSQKCRNIQEADFIKITDIIDTEDTSTKKEEILSKSEFESILTFIKEIDSRDAIPIKNSWQDAPEVYMLINNRVYNFMPLEFDSITKEKCDDCYWQLYNLLIKLSPIEIKN